MTILVVDPRNGDRCADLFVIDSSWRVDRLRLGYVPELHHDTATNELLVVDTQLPRFLQRKTSYWLTCYAADTLKMRRRTQTPERPMYSGFSNRSVRVTSTPSGRYIYVLESRMLVRAPVQDDVFRVLVHRYDRSTGALSVGQLQIDSCLLDFGHLGATEDDLYFHLSCDYPSTVAFGNFGSANLELVDLEHLPSRSHDERETCGSWLDRESGALYCITGHGTIHEVRRTPPASRALRHLELAEGESIPLAMIYGARGQLFVGIAADVPERAMGLASRICRMTIAEPGDVQTRTLPFPVLNFVVSADGRTLAGTNPFDQTVCVVDTESWETIQIIDNLGCTPGEVFVLP